MNLNFAQYCLVLGFLMGGLVGASAAELWRTLFPGLPAAPERERLNLDNQTTRVTAYPSGRGAGDDNAR